MVKNVKVRLVAAVAGLMLLCGGLLCPAYADDAADALRWPEPTGEMRPWTRWWWHGSAVDNENLSRLLETYAAAGLGGVEITCIYGVRGAEDRSLPYLSDEWVDAVRHAIDEAHRLGMQVDLPAGSGWRMGGPSVADADANSAVVIDTELLPGGASYERTFDDRPQALAACSDGGQVVDLLALLDADGRVEWPVPADGEWTLYVVTSRWSGDRVKRPSPGGEGKNINPLSRPALENFLEHFATAAADLLPGIRAQFHDSYEYEGDWCDDFFTEFESRRGYQLQDHLPALAGVGDADDVARVKSDYRETVSDLVLENFIKPWVAWSHRHGMLARNQSHGSPANWLDLYAAVDIPETESFGRLVGGDTHRLVFMFASSAAHVAGRPLASSESATWLEEHFQETLGQVKEILDRQFLAGINHTIYHGTCYSPADADWPGWLFYASTQLNPQNPLWRDFPALNDYVTHCQSILQSTQADNDVLLYWPIHDLWHSEEQLRMDFRVHNAHAWLFDTPFGTAAEWLDENGYTFDFVSDRQLAKCRVENGRVASPGSDYAIVLVPGARLMPLATLRQLLDLAEAGATVIFRDELPIGPPGMRHGEQREEWNEQIARLAFESSEFAPTQTASVGRGRVIVVHNLAAALAATGVPQETWSSPQGLKFHRRAWPGGHYYLVKNESQQPFEGWIAPAVDWRTAGLLDPLDGRIGLADVREGDDAQRELRLQLAPKQSIFVKTFADAIEGPHWAYRQPAGQATPIAGRWSVEFIAGGPELPASLTTERLQSWTELAADEGERFAGTARYSIAFDAPNGAGGRLMLDLGRVADSARVELNGKPVATLFAAPFQVEIGPLLPRDNRLVIEVTNVAANRIRDLDRRDVRWRIFHDINFVDINYRPFNASNWPVREAGLLGPVTLTPLE